LDVKGMGLTHTSRPILQFWRLVEGNGTSGVAVKCVDIGRNTSGEGGFLGQF
jgi:hypothetical protein